MKSFESVYKELQYLLIQKLPENIEKINKEHNDGIMISDFVNTNLEEICIKTPSFKFNLEETEYSEKDRIIENTIFMVSLEIKLPPNAENKNIIIWRYVEALNKLFYENGTTFSYILKKQLENKIIIQIT